jgi:glycosyltransferase involved in cell wall biosynthesis
MAAVYGAVPGRGGLGYFAATAIGAISMEGCQVMALGPAVGMRWPLPGTAPPVTWIESPAAFQGWTVRYLWVRWRSGKVTQLRDRHVGRWAASELEKLRPQCCYLFTQVGLEGLQWCRRNGVPSVVDSPNGDIRNFQRVYTAETSRWFGKKYHGHPTDAMVQRVVEEYHLADRIRVHSRWAKQSMVRFGVPEDKIHVLQETLNLESFSPPPARPVAEGPLRVSYVGTLDLRKGFVYLLKAIRAVGAKHIQLRIVGATGDRDCARLFARERHGLQVEAAPGDPLPVYHQSEVFVLPTLEDGLGLVALEAQACNVPAIVTEEAGAKECVRPGETGWIVPSGDADAIAAALEQALCKRKELWEMGRQARVEVERYAGSDRLRQVSDWFWSRTNATAGGRG